VGASPTRQTLQSEATGAAMEVTKRRIVDRRVLHLIKMWLESAVEETDDRGRKTRTTEPARHSARFTHLTAAGESLHAPVVLGMEDARAGAKPRLTYRDLRRRSRDPVPEGQSRRGVATTARDHGQAEAHGQRREDTNLQGTGRRVRLPGVHGCTQRKPERRIWGTGQRGRASSEWWKTSTR